MARTCSVPLAVAALAPALPPLAMRGTVKRQASAFPVVRMPIVCPSVVRTPPVSSARPCVFRSACGRRVSGRSWIVAPSPRRRTPQTTNGLIPSSGASSQTRHQATAASNRLSNVAGRCRSAEAWLLTSARATRGRKDRRRRTALYQALRAILLRLCGAPGASWMGDHDHRGVGRVGDASVAEALALVQPAGGVLPVDRQAERLMPLLPRQR